MSRILNVEKERWHPLDCLESSTILLGAKDCAYAPLGPEDILEK